MLISDKHRFIFIHNYKVAGTSVKNALKPYALLNPPHIKFVREVFEMNRGLEFQGSRVLRKLGFDFFKGHNRAWQIREVLGEPYWDYMYTFGFVRNPWDWQVSLYHYMLKFTDHHQHEFIKSLKSFDEYIEWRVNEDLHLQSEAFVGKNGKVIMDFIGKMETLNQDFEEIADKIGLNNVKLPHKNKSKHKKYSEYYSKHSRDLVKKHFAEDIERFKYSF